MAFHWDISAADGCGFLKADKPPGWAQQSSPCIRALAGSTVDHFEPREPALDEDAFARNHWKAN